MRRLLSPRLAGAAWLVLAVLGCMTESAGVPAPTPVSAGAEARVAELRRLGIERGNDAASIGASLPKTADGAVELAPPGASVAVRFTLLGAAPAPPVALEGASIYRGALEGADLAHVILPDGVEDLVFFDRAPSREELVYRIDVSRAAGLRLNGGSLELLDETGAPRVRVDRPWLVDATGERRWLDLTVEGCSVDRDERAPFGRPVTRPGAGSCRLAITWHDVRYPAVVDPAWKLGTSIGARFGFQTFTYANGRVIACGGRLSCAGTCGNGIVDSCTIFDPVARTWALGPGLPSGREDGAVAALPSGRAFFIGGSGGSRAELITANGAVTRSEDFFGPGAGASAVLLGTGKVLVTGGSGASAMLYDETTDTYTTAGTSPVGAMKVARSFHTTTRLLSGKVLVAGGGPASAEIYDPATNTFTLVPAAMNVARQGHIAATLTDGKVLLAFGGSATAEIFDPAGTGTFTPTDAGVADRDRASAVTLDSGDIMVLGGESAGGPVGTVEIFDVVTKKFSSQPPLLFARSRLGASKLAPPTGAKGEVVAFGGRGTTGYSLASTEIWGPGVPGSTCTTGDDCRSGDCQEGICCATACSTTCKTCVANTGACVQTLKADDPSTCTGPNTCDGAGACKKKNGQTCAAPADCASGNCVDGTCCDRACNGQCEACNVPGVAGSCAPIAGAPRGGRPACTATGTTCGGTCNGAEGATCAYPGAVTTCGSACAGDKLTLSTCDGKGACSIDVARGCAGNFICADAKVCKTSCASNTDCAQGYQCLGARCLPIALCEDHFVTKGESRIDCFPYTCEQTGNCRTSCASVADCVAPTLCSLDGQCVDPPPPPETGCAIAPAVGAHERGFSGAFVAALAFLAMRARRSRRAMPRSAEATR